MLLDTGWRFRLGDQENAFEKNFSDADWREVALPHDWSVEYPKDRISPAARVMLSAAPHGTAGISLFRQAQRERKFFSALTAFTKTARSGLTAIISAGARTDIYLSGMI